MKSPYLNNPYEDRILKTLKNAHRSLTTKQIAEYSGISYNATISNLEKLEKKGKVKQFKDTNRIYWEIREEE